MNRGDQQACSAHRVDRALSSLQAGSGTRGSSDLVTVESEGGLAMAVATDRLDQCRRCAAAPWPGKRQPTSGRAIPGPR